MGAPINIYIYIAISCIVVPHKESPYRGDPIYRSSGELVSPNGKSDSIRSYVRACGRGGVVRGWETMLLPKLGSGRSKRALAWRGVAWRGACPWSCLVIRRSRGLASPAWKSYAFRPCVRARRAVVPARRCSFRGCVLQRRNVLRRGVAWLGTCPSSCLVMLGQALVSFKAC